jgi:predicted amidohydrolase
VRIALAQLAASPVRAANLARCLETMTAAREAGAELIAFPEVILDPFFPQYPLQKSAGDAKALDLAEPVPGPTTEKVAERARELGLVTVFNLYELDDQGRRFDSSPVIDADGRLLGVTRMIHITDYEGFHERDYYHPGDRGVPVYETRVGRIGVAICYDRHYPEVMRALGSTRPRSAPPPSRTATSQPWPTGWDRRLGSISRGSPSWSIPRGGSWRGGRAWRRIW